MMGLFDFIFGKKNPAQKQEPVVKKLSNEEEPPDKLRQLKTYAEDVAEPCGFDFSAVRRWHSEKGVWWAEGANFDKIIDALTELRPMEDFIREDCPEFPKINGHARHFIRPYTPGQNSNVVPTLTEYSTKNGSGIEARMRICRSESSPLTVVTLRFKPDGGLFSAKFLFFKHRGAPRYEYEFATYKRGVPFRLKDAKRNGTSVLANGKSS